MALTLGQGARLMESLSFENRVRMSMMRQALLVANEVQGSQSADRWNKRRQLALRVLTSPNSNVTMFETLVASDPGSSLNWWAPINISGSTTANPSVVTTAIAHGLVTGDVAEIAAHQGNTNINHTWMVTVLTTTTFSVPIPGNAAGTANTGTVQKMETDANINFTISNQWNAMAGVAAGEA
jgi:hypothetical protein